MILTQRIFALVMAIAMCVFIVPIAVARHHLDIAVGAVAAFFLYVGFNAYLWVRTRRNP